MEEVAWNEKMVITHRKEDNALLSLKDTFQLRRRMIQREFPGRNFPQLFSRFHYVRMKSTTPQNYVEELKVNTNFFIFRMLMKT